MNINYKKECERQLLSLDAKFNYTYQEFSKSFTPQQMFRGVCVATARQAVSEYYQKLQDRDLSESEVA